MVSTLKGRGYRWWTKVEAHDEDLLLQRRVLTRPCDLKKSHLHFRYKLQMLPRGLNPIHSSKRSREALASCL
jgi:hypothetical protein